MTQREQHLTFWLVILALLVVVLTVFRDILLPFVMGVVIAYFLNPLADLMQRRGISRGVAAFTLVVVSGALFITTMILLAPVLATQAKQLATTLPGEIDRLRLSIESLARARFGAQYPAIQAAIERGFADLQAGWTGSIGAIASAVLSRGLALINLVSLLLITPLVVFYLLLDWHPMLNRLHALLPRDHAGTITGLTEDINDAIAAFIRGQGTICLFLGLFYAVGLSLVGLKYGLVVGLATGLLAFVPMVGWALGLMVAMGLGIAQFGADATHLAAIAAVLAAGMALDTAVLSPRFVGEKVGLHPVWLIFALFAFSYLFGFVGTLVAVPLAAAVGVLIRHGMKLYIASDIYRGTSEERGKL